MIIEDLIKSCNLRIKIKNKSVHRLRTSLGTKINKNKTARQVLRLNILYSRRQGFPIHELSKAYQISMRTVQKYTKQISNIYYPLQQKRFRSMVKLFTRATLTNKWIQYIIRHRITDLTSIMTSISEGSKPP